MVNKTWFDICAEQDLTLDSGVCALFDDEQVAIFKCSGDEDLFAISNFDPIGEANVLSRGIVGSIGEKRVVSSPLFKQHFCLKTGECLEEADMNLKTYDIRSHQGTIQLSHKAVG
ncbi:MAG: nitrite reductase small subunit NirD [Pseudomonadales bacterium]|nr:nitrite reductase small subunit NirD [Pseudomonadales bacterium]